MNQNFFAPLEDTSLSGVSAFCPNIPRRSREILGVFAQKAHLALDEREVLHDLAQSCGLKLYVPSQAQFLGLRNEMVTLALKCWNFPVPPENVAVPVRVTRLSST